MTNSFGRQGGFSLIEVVVSIGLLSVMSILAYQALEVVMATNDRSHDTMSQQVNLRRAWAIIQRDLLHMRNRPFNDGLGQLERPYETDLSEFGVRFSRGGGPMLASNPSGLMRVYYGLDDERNLVRTTWAITASPRYSDGNTRTLLSNVDEVIFEHLSEKNEYSENWPPLNSQSAPMLPKMIRVMIKLKDGDSTSRLFPGVIVE
ncbi:MAG: type II secretion system protein GspJ [Porticoccaceae bacterium]|nr:type II secretion system protein GspJ [Porticoccaceae bacterium]